jgi:methanogenic corrinoid protein MtbC1
MADEDRKMLPRRQDEPADTGGVADEVCASITGLLGAVKKKLEVEARYAPERVPPDKLGLVMRTQEHFAAMLSAVCRFDLYDDLGREFAWYVRLLAGRGLGATYFETMLDAWILAFHATLGDRSAGRLGSLLEELREGVARLVEEGGKEAGALAPEASGVLELLLAGDRGGLVERVLGLLRSGRSVEEIYVLVGAAMEEIGRGWQSGRLGVAAEHTASEIARYALMRMRDEAPRDETLELTALVTCVPDEDHQMGAEALAGYLEIRGWRVVFLGRGSPVGDVIEAVRDTRPDVVMVSASLIANLPGAFDLLTSLRELEPRPVTLVGGRAAIKARGKLQPVCDGVVQTFGEAHETALRLVS